MKISRKKIRFCDFSFLGDFVSGDDILSPHRILYGGNLLSAHRILRGDNRMSLHPAQDSVWGKYVVPTILCGDNVLSDEGSCVRTIIVPRAGTMYCPH